MGTRFTTTLIATTLLAPRVMQSARPATNP